LYYDRELSALRSAGRFRQRTIYNSSIKDFASNDYLGLADDPKRLKNAFRAVEAYSSHAPKASMLVNGYHPIHREFEKLLCGLNGFEAGIVAGSGFLANTALIESLVRKKDHLFIDEEYHASGMLAARLVHGRVSAFRHNDPDDLRLKLRSSDAKRKIIAVEGVYSMSGDLLNRAIFDVAGEADALLIVDEAHSAGVLGRKLLGIFDHYGIVPAYNHIKMGTLGKAYGSYGAYILASGEIVNYLENRAKPLIYSTALSIMDTALALENVKYIQKKHKILREKIDRRLSVLKQKFNTEVCSMIVPFPAKSNRQVLSLQRYLLEKGYLAGAIRQPTVKHPILRIIPRLGNSTTALEKMLKLLQSV